MIDALAVLMAIGIVVAAVTLIGFVLKLVVGILLIPLHIVSWLLQGALALVVGVVVLTVVLPAVLGFLPVLIVLGLLALPVLFVGWLVSSCAI